MWRYHAAMPILDGEQRVSIGEGMTPLIELPHLAKETGVRRLWVKDEGQNPTGSFKARGLCMAVTRAKALGLPGVCVPTAGNAGIALAAYAAAARMPARIYAPATTPPPILGSIRAYGAQLELVDGHIGDAGKATTQFAKESGFFNVATVREPYRVEGMKTMGFEVAEQLGWTLPDVIVYPTGGGEGTIGIWKAIGEMVEWGWLAPKTAKPKMVIAQAEGEQRRRIRGVGGGDSRRDIPPCVHERNRRRAGGWLRDQRREKDGRGRARLEGRERGSVQHRVGGELPLVAPASLRFPMFHLRTPPRFE